MISEMRFIRASCLLALLQLLYHAFQIRIAGAKASRDKVSAALSDRHSIGDYLKLPCLARRNHWINAQPFFDEVCETRDLGLIVLSGRAGTYLDFHYGSPICNFFHLNPRTTRPAPKAPLFFSHKSVFFLSFAACDRPD